METVSIVGVGLIGGSFALALRKAGFRGKILGVSSRRTTSEALRLGVIDEAAPLEEAVPRSDLVYLSQPISRIIEIIGQLDSLLKPGALVTDAGSTKSAIAEAARAHIRPAAFLGGHPMAGKESRGVAVAEAGLFDGRPYVITPAAPSQLRRSPAREFVAWLRRIGARPIFLSAEEHDRVAALASHLPQLASTALAATLASSGEDSAIAKVAGPGLRDMSRLALSQFDIWADIVETNSIEIEEALTAYIRQLEEIRASLRSGALKEKFGQASRLARKLRRPGS